MHTDCFTEASLDYAGVYSEHLCITSANLSSVLSKATPHFQLCLPQTHKPCSMTGLFLMHIHSLCARVLLWACSNDLTIAPIAVGLINTFLQAALPTVPHQ